jgi:hypothetical protein
MDECSEMAQCIGRMCELAFDIGGAQSKIIRRSLSGWRWSPAGPLTSKRCKKLASSVHFSRMDG